MTTAVTGMLENLDFSWDKLESGLQRLDSLRPHILLLSKAKLSDYGNITATDAVSKNK